MSLFSENADAEIYELRIHEFRYTQTRHVILSNAHSPETFFILFSNRLWAMKRRFALWKITKTHRWNIRSIPNVFNIQKRKDVTIHHLRIRKAVSVRSAKTNYSIYDWRYKNPSKSRNKCFTSTNKNRRQCHSIIADLAIYYAVESVQLCFATDKSRGINRTKVGRPSIISYHIILYYYSIVRSI